MNITNVKLTLLNNSNTLALANITIDSDFVVNGLKVLSGKRGLWVAMPNRKDSKNEYHDVAHAVSKEAYQTIQDTVIAKYKETESYDGEKKPTVDNTDMNPGTREDFTKLQEDPNGLHDIKEDDLPF